MFYSSNSLPNFADWQEFLKEKVKQGKIELEQVHLTEIFNYFPRDLTLYSIQYSPKLVQAEEARKKAIEDMDPKQREAFENMKLYKFYPVKTPDTPDVNNMKVWSCSRVPITWMYLNLQH